MSRLTFVRVLVWWVIFFLGVGGFGVCGGVGGGGGGWRDGSWAGPG